MCPFGRDQDFMTGLAQVYEEGLAALAHLYGGMHMDISAFELDDWESIWLKTKVDFIDSFHTIIQDLSVTSGEASAEESEQMFSTVIALLDLPPSSIVQVGGTPAPFLN
jgi:activating signal cointegrator complex subunit 2